MVVGIVIALGVIAIAAGVFFLLVAHWTHTPHGRLDARTAILLKLIGLIDRDDPAPNALALRASRKRSMALVGGRPGDLGDVRDLRVPGPASSVPVRTYNPSPGGPPLPVIVYYHGGGYVIGDLDTHDGVCRSIARRSGCLVLSVDYRLAPEHRLPAAVDDACADLRWIADSAGTVGGDPSRIAVAGDSAGASLATVVAILARDQGGPHLCAQALVYPGVDASTTDRPSCRFFATGYLLTTGRLRWFYDQYVPAASDRSDIRVSPILAADLGRLPPALVLTAQFDPLRDEGEEYARKLEAAGVPVLMRRFDGMVHGFLSVDRWLPAAREAVDLVASFLRERLSAPEQPV